MPDARSINIALLMEGGALMRAVYEHGPLLVEPLKHHRPAVHKLGVLQFCSNGTVLDWPAT